MNTTNNETNTNTTYMFAFRYALGKRTFAPSIATSYLSKRLSCLSDSTIDKMIYEIDKCEDYGDECDKTTWFEFRQTLTDELRRRAMNTHYGDTEERITWVKPIEECGDASEKCKEAVDKLREGIHAKMTELITKADNVNHPSHYCDGKIEVIDFIEDKNLGYHLGNVIKYVSRAGKKDANKTIEDLKKARWYLDRYIERLETTNEE